MTELDVYANRLVALGYKREDAAKIVNTYRGMEDLDGLEDYIFAKECVERRDG